MTAAIHVSAQHRTTVGVRAGEDDAFRRQTGKGPDALTGVGGAVVEAQPLDGDQQQGIALLLFESEADGAQPVVDPVGRRDPGGITGEEDAHRGCDVDGGQSCTVRSP